MKQFETRITQKSDIESNWQLATFVPRRGEMLVYLPDENNTTPRIKIGDGINIPNDLPFVTSESAISADVIQTPSGNYSVILNNTKDNQVLGLYGFAGGKSSIAGMKAYYISAFDFDNKQLYLSKTQVTLPTIGAGVKDESFETPPYNIGAYIGIGESGQYLYTAKIEAVENNVVTYSGDLGFDASLVIERTDPDEHTFYVPEQPDIGAITFGSNNFAFGEGANALGTGAVAIGPDVIANKCSAAFGYFNKANAYSFVAGQNNIAGGMFTAAVGQGNFVGTRGGFATGINNISKGQSAFAEGENTQAIAERSHAMGLRTIASGSNSLAMGDRSDAQGQNSFAGGFDSTATKFNSFAFGNSVLADGLASAAFGIGSKANGDYSFAAGVGTIATSYGETVCGKYNDNTIHTFFAVGFGSDEEHRANAFSVLRSGAAEVAAQGTSDNSVVLYKTFNDKIKEINSVSDLVGKGSGNKSIAMQGGTASGNYSIASGLLSEASGYISTALGYGAKATGSMSFAVNKGTIARRDGSTAVGSYNIEDSNAYFIVGNGSSDDNRKNAFVVYYDGTATIQTQGNSDDSIVQKKYVDDAIAGIEITGGGTDYSAEIAELQTNVEDARNIASTADTRSQYNEQAIAELNTQITSIGNKYEVITGSYLGQGRAEIGTVILKLNWSYEVAKTASKRIKYIKIIRQDGDTGFLQGDFIGLSSNQDEGYLCGAPSGEGIAPKLGVCIYTQNQNPDWNTLILDLYNCLDGVVNPFDTQDKLYRYMIVLENE